MNLWKRAGKVGSMSFLGRVKMLEEWRWSTMIPSYKNKGDIQNYNYKSIKLLCHTRERVVEMNIMKDVCVYF